MEFSELIEKRYSVRAYKADPVEDDKLQQVLRAARLAPSAGNLRLDTREKADSVILPCQLTTCPDGSAQDF
jgi:nitroreductase